MDQEIQEAKSLYYSYKQYFSDYLPALTKLGLKVVMALLVFVGGRKVIEREINEEDHAKLIDEFISNVGEAS